MSFKYRCSAHVTIQHVHQYTAPNGHRFMADKVFEILEQKYAWTNPNTDFELSHNDTFLVFCTDSARSKISEEQLSILICGV